MILVVGNGSGFLCGWAFLNKCWFCMAECRRRNRGGREREPGDISWKSLDPHCETKEMEDHVKQNVRML